MPPSEGEDLRPALAASIVAVATMQTAERVRRGRDAVARVLRQYVGEARAMERANNVAQAWADGLEDRARTAVEMLRGYGLEDADLRNAAERIVVAWAMATAVVGCNGKCRGACHYDLKGGR